MIDINLKLFNEYSFNIKDSTTLFDTQVKDMDIHVFHNAHNTYLMIKQGNNVMVGYGYVDTNTNLLSISEDAVMVIPLNTNFMVNSDSGHNMYQITDNMTITDIMKLYVSIMNGMVSPARYLMDSEKFSRMLSSTITYLRDKNVNSLLLNDMHDTDLVNNNQTVTTKLMDITQLFIETENESFFVLNRDNEITVLPYMVSEEGCQLFKRYMISIPINTSFYIYEGDSTYISQLDANTSIENLLVLWRCVYNTNSYRLDSAVVNPDIILKTRDIIPCGYQEVASNIFMIIIKDNATIEAELAKKDAVRSSYSIEVTLEALTEDNPSQPFFATLWEEVDGERFNCYSDCGISHEDAFAKVLHFYNTFKKQ